MAFDLVNYLNDQIKIQKPFLLNPVIEKDHPYYLAEFNALILGKLIVLWRQNHIDQFKKLIENSPEYSNEILRNLIHPTLSNTNLKQDEISHIFCEILSLQLNELRQLEKTGQYGAIGLRDLLKGQIEYLAKQADDWVWSANTLTELKSSKISAPEDISLAPSDMESNQMVQNTHSHAEQTTEELKVPCWAKILEPVVALVILWILFCALCNIFA